MALVVAAFSFAALAFRPLALYSLRPLVTFLDLVRCFFFWPADFLAGPNFFVSLCHYFVLFIVLCVVCVRNTRLTLIHHFGNMGNKR